MVARNALANQRWDFEVPSINNLLQPIQGGIRFSDERQQRAKQAAGNLALLTLQESDPNRRAEKWRSFLATHPNAAGLDQRYHDPAVGPMAVLADAGMAQTYLDYQMKRAAEARAAEGLNLQRSAESRAAAMHAPQLEMARVQAETARREFENPRQSVTLSPDQIRATIDRRTGMEIPGTRIEGPKKGPDSTARKAIYEAQDELPNIQGSIDVLNEARALLPQIYTGYGAGLRSSFNQAAPGVLPNVISDPRRAQATQRYNQIMNAEAISAMSQTLKGATTNEEMRAFVTMMNDPTVGVDVKLRVIDQMTTAAQRRQKNLQDRITELGGRMPDLSAGGGQPVRVNSPDEARKLPKGTPILLPDGTMGRVP